MDLLGRAVPVSWFYPRSIVRLRRLGSEEMVDVGAAEIVVVLIHDPEGDVDPSDSLQALAAHTPAEVPLVALSLGSELVAALASEVAGRLCEPDRELGHTDRLATVARSTPAADIVLLASTHRVVPGWLPRLAAAAHSGDAVATASPLTAERLGGAFASGDAAATDAAIRSAALRAYPRVQLGGPGCLYVRRDALQLLGVEALLGTSAHCVMKGCTVAAIDAGLVNVLADDLFVDGCPSPPAPERPVPSDVAAMRALDDHDETTALRRITALSTTATRGLTVTIDGRSLTRVGGGTQRYALELITALHRFTDVSLRVVVPPDLAPDAAAALARAPEVDVITYDQAAAGVPRSDVVHRPQQVFSPEDLSLLRMLGHRIVVTHQDLIAYHNPTYHSTPDSWEQHRRITRLALAAADRVLFFSESARRDAQSEDLIGDGRSEVVGIALESPFPEDPHAPGGLADDSEFVLCLGADYRHKNRPFAIAVVEALRNQHGWLGRLVLAGAHVDHGSSAAQERALRDSASGSGTAVVDLGAVSEDERAWLMTRARALIVPSVVEGFGLLPLEAAAAGVPCLFAARSSLREVVSESLATLVPWDENASAARAHGLLKDGQARSDHVRRLREDASRWRWERLVSGVVAAYEQAVRSPFRAASAHAWQELERERALAEVTAFHADLLAHLGDRMALARDDGFFTAEQQRGLLRVGSRPALTRAVMWPFGLLGGIRLP